MNSKTTLIALTSLSFAILINGPHSSAATDTTCESKVAQAESKLDDATNKFNKAEKDFLKAEKSCVKAQDKLDKYVVKSTDTLNKLNDKLEIARKDEDDAKSCGGIFSVGDLCGGSALDKARKKRRQAENALETETSKVERQTEVYSRKKNNACASSKKKELALQPIEAQLDNAEAAYRAVVQQCIQPGSASTCQSKAEIVDDYLDHSTDSFNDGEKEFTKTQNSCEKSQDTLDKYLVKSSEKVDKTFDKLELARKDEDKAKSCGGLFPIGDLCGGAAYEKAKRKRRIIELEYATLQEKVFGETQYYTNKRDSACTATVEEAVELQALEANLNEAQAFKNAVALQCH